MEVKNKKNRWSKPKIIAELPFKRTANGNVGEGDDCYDFGYCDS